MDPTVLEKLEEIHTSCNAFMNNYQATFNLPTKCKTKRKNELKDELKLVLEDIDNIGKFCKDKNSLKEVQKMLDPVKTTINKILKPKLIITHPTISHSGSSSNGFATNFVDDITAAATINSTRTNDAATNSTRTNGAATNSTRTNGAATNSAHTSKTSATSNKVRINTACRITISATACTDLNNNNNNNHNNTCLGKRKSTRSGGGKKRKKTN
ncbi:hypothetical protein Glove_463g20 [Diversispora epigaea]|uniref:Uncharacterized protein n=1 Tax=Diversispora epigaea TaxID=1348612 RepID=A0A397GP08_9GLOM|nr:hypothetical protein Glove_463g20 [Diversispora epigaea]